MSSTTSSSEPTPTPAPPAAAAFLELRERSRALLRERSTRLQDLETRMTSQVSELARLVQDHLVAGIPPPQAGEAVARLEAENRHLQRLRQESEEALCEAQVVLGEMESERRMLVQRLEEMEQRGPAASPATQASRNVDEEVERLQRRLELALQEIRELKQQNSELATRATSSSPSPAPRVAAVSIGAGFDWETQKQRLIQQLETDSREATAEQKAERLRIDEVIRTTDRVIAEKDREIESLRAELTRVGVASDSEKQATQQATQQAVDTDEAIRTEREKLHRVQEEWREKLRKAEVEISIERAKLARERLQLEERLRTQAAATPGSTDDSKGSDPKAAASAKGKWLTRLGLGGAE